MLSGVQVFIVVKHMDWPGVCCAVEQAGDDGELDSALVVFQRGYYTIEAVDQYN